MTKAETRRQAAAMLHLLNNMSTEQFARGADRPVREFLEALAGPLDPTPEEVRAKWL